MPKKANQSGAQVTRTPLHRISAEEFLTVQATLELAAFLIVPRDMTQRKAFESLMPQVFYLRHRKVEWKEIAELLRQSGLRLEVSTIRNYYDEMLPACLDLCKEQLMRQPSML